MGRTLVLMWFLFFGAFGGLLFLYAQSLPIRDENAELPLVHALPAEALTARDWARPTPKAEPQPSTQVNDPRKQLAEELPDRSLSQDGIKPSRQRARHDISRSAKALVKSPPRSASGDQPLFGGILRRAFGG